MASYFLRPPESINARTSNVTEQTSVYLSPGVFDHFEANIDYVDPPSKVPEELDPNAGTGADASPFRYGVSVTGIQGGTPIIAPNPVGGSDSVSLRTKRYSLFDQVGEDPLKMPGHYLENLLIAGDDRAAIKTYNEPKGPVWLKNVSINGGWTPSSDTAKANSKWGIHGYGDSSWREEDLVVRGIYWEHARYRHPHGAWPWDHVSVGAVIAHCGRTALQLVSRIGEGPRPGPGSVWEQRSYVQDVCLEQGGGGSAYTFRGGLYETRAVLDRCVVRQGCTPGLSPKWQENITGCLVVGMEKNKDGSPRMWDDDTGFGLESMTVSNCHFEMGTVYPGKNSARRPNVMIDNVARFCLRGGAIINGPDANPTALQIGNTWTELELWMNTNVVGRCIFQGTTYDTYQQMLKAIDGMSGVKVITSA